MASPFKTNSIADQIMSKRKPEGGMEDSAPEGDMGEPSDDEGLNVAARDLIDAIHAGDEAGVSAALKSAFELLEAAPHEEAEPQMDMGDMG